MLHRGLTIGLLAVAFTLIAPAPSLAELPFHASVAPFSAPDPGRYRHEIGLGKFFRNLFGLGKKGSGGGAPAGQGNHAPELDPTGVGSAAILLLGGSLVLMDRRRRARTRSNPAG